MNDKRVVVVAETGRNALAEIDFAGQTVPRRFSVGLQGDGLAIAP